jgi:hypothetical protein
MTPRAALAGVAAAILAVPALLSAAAGDRPSLTKHKGDHTRFGERKTLTKQRWQRKRRTRQLIAKTE